MRRIGIGILAVIVAALSGVLVFAPHSLTMLMEGTPTLEWTGRGTYVDVPGETPAEAPDQAVPARPINDALHDLLREKGGVALLASHNGQLVLEHYAEGHAADTRYNSFSMVKSLVGALVFKALAEGKLDSLDQTIGDLLPESPGLAALTLRRLITMRAGIHFDGVGSAIIGPTSLKDSDTMPNPFGPLARLHYEGLPSIQSSLTMDVSAPDIMTYQNVNTALLAAVLEKVYAKPLEVLLSEKIWRPAGAATAAWRKPTEDASVSAYCCLYATARDWIEVGHFLLRNGNPGDQFLPEPLWREWLGLDIDQEARREGHYGNHMFQDVLDRPGAALQGPFSYFVGEGGQILYLMPEQDLVVFRAGSGIQLLHSTLYEVWESIARPQAR